MLFPLLFPSFPSLPGDSYAPFKVQLGCLEVHPPMASRLISPSLHSHRTSYVPLWYPWVLHWGDSLRFNYSGPLSPYNHVRA